MDTPSHKNFSDPSIARRSYTAFFLILVLIAGVLTLITITPKLNRVLEEQFEAQMVEETEFESELLAKFVERQIALIDRLASNPGVIYAALYSNANNINLGKVFQGVDPELDFSAVSLQNNKGTLVQQNGQRILAQYNENESWANDILSGAKPYHFQILGQFNNKFTFKISVPVLYKNTIEGIVSAEITRPLSYAIIALKYKKGVAFRIEQNQTAIQSETTAIAHPFEVATELPNLGMQFFFIADKTSIERRKDSVRNYFFVAVSVALLVAFVLLSQTGLCTLQLPQ